MGFRFFLLLILPLISGAVEIMDLGESFEDRPRRWFAEMQPLDLKKSPNYSPAIVEYFQRYRLEFAGTRHYFGSFDSADYRIAAHVFVPPSPRGSVFLIHGYLDHTGLLQPLTGFLLDLGFVVAAFDLPGHGLSSGPRGSIDSFSEYVAVLQDFLAMCERHLPRPFQVIGHSTGGAVVIEHLRNAADRPVFEKVVLLAPLVRSAHWILSMIGYRLAEPFAETIPRQFRENSSDPAFLEFVRSDPLRIREVPLQWIRALHSWNEAVHGSPRIPGRVLMVQGTADDIVDWEYNIAFLREKLSDVTEVRIPGARHQLVNERWDLRAQVFSHIRNYLEADRD